MSAPKYIQRDGSEGLYRAVRYVKGLPSSHWHVNHSHPRIELLKDVDWVQTKFGPVEIRDGQWVVLTENDGLLVLDDAEFVKTYKPQDDYE